MWTSRTRRANPGRSRLADPSDTSCRAGGGRTRRWATRWASRLHRQRERRPRRPRARYMRWLGWRRASKAFVDEALGDLGLSASLDVEEGRPDHAVVVTRSG